LGGTALAVEAPHNVDPVVVLVYALILSFDVIVSAVVEMSGPCLLPPIGAIYLSGVADGAAADLNSWVGQLGYENSLSFVVSFTHFISSALMIFYNLTFMQKYFQVIFLSFAKLLH
jgi:hypothetical protein